MSEIYTEETEIKKSSYFIYIVLLVLIIIIAVLYYFRNHSIFSGIRKKITDQCPSCPTCTNLLGLRSLNINITWPIISEQELLGVWETRGVSTRYIVEFESKEYANMKTIIDGNVSIPIPGLVHTNALLVANNEINKLIYEDKAQRLNVASLTNTAKRIQSGNNLPEVKNIKYKYETNWILPNNTVISINDGKASIGKINEGQFTLDSILPYTVDSINENSMLLQSITNDISGFSGIKLYYNEYDDTLNIITMELSKKLI
jgi:hypothetical protein